MSKIIELCGEIPEGFEKVDISSNPDFVFKNDPAYSARELFDEEGNKVFVNSFIECDHYVSGGWGFTPLKNNELQAIDTLTYVVIFFLLLTYSKNVIKKLLNK